jgi:serine/threonine-protein kinase
MKEAKPRRIGPYRLEGTLGRGGMGEVFVAYDERLDRRVAIKLIHPEAAADAGARERFRREARAAAGLSHSAIVQVYDILAVAGDADGGGSEVDAIVMELVAGETLAKRLRGGPCDLDTALRLGVELAGGLAAAHASGLVHRDLKAENVMIDSAGHARILDFGLAKRPQTGDDPALTARGMVIGTSRAMSPEQARGLALDSRTDLFALGVLLYEAVTGGSPFLAGSTLDTLNRVCTFRQPPAIELRPELPPEVSQLIDRLLEKDPGRRPQKAVEVEALLARAAASRTASGAGGMPRLPTGEQPTWMEEALPSGDRSPAQSSASPLSDAASPVGGRMPALSPLPAPIPVSAFDGWSLRRGGGWVLGAALAGLIGASSWLWLRHPAAAPLSVAVTRAEIGAGRGLEGVDLLAAAVRVALMRGLLSLDRVSPLAPEQVDPVGGLPAAVARATAADEVVTSHLECDAASCQVVLARVRGSNGTLLWTQTFEVPFGQPYLLAEAVTSHLRDGYPERLRHDELSPLEVRAADYAEYLRLHDELDRHRQGQSLDVLIARARQLRQRAPRFLEAMVLEADLRRLRFASRRAAADLDEAAAALRDAALLAPGDPRPLFGLFDVEMLGERLTDAESTVAGLERLFPGEPEVEVARARLHERRGDNKLALAMMLDAVHRRPSWRCLFRLANLENHLGQVSAASAHLRQLLARYPGYYYARAMLAQNELLSGSPEAAVTLYLDLVRNAPQARDLNNLGDAYLLLARYPDAEERFRQALRLEPANALMALDLADVVLLEGRTTEAMPAYRHVLELAARDPGAAGWQLISCQAQAHAHLGERSPAVADAQRVLVLAQGNPQADYEVALVYCLVGEESSALVNAERALAEGIQPRWLDLPWFDRLRATPELRQLLKAARRG